MTLCEMFYLLVEWKFKDLAHENKFFGNIIFKSIDFLVLG